VNQYHHESLKRRVVMLLVHTSLLCEPVSLRVVMLLVHTSLLCEPVSLQVVKVTSCDAVSSHKRQDLIHSLVPAHYVCNKFI
jgi:hypothetical protein